MNMRKLLDHDHPVLTRKEIRTLYRECCVTAQNIDCGNGPSPEYVAELLRMCSKVLSIPIWFSNEELLIVGRAMDVLHLTRADARTMRIRLDSFFTEHPELKDHYSAWGYFAAFLAKMPNGGVE